MGRLARHALTAITIVASLAMMPSSAEAACYSQNVTYWNQTIPVATACIHHYQHGNAFGAAYSKVYRVAQPPGYSFYCTYAGTRVVKGNPLQNGPLVWSSASWSQSTLFLSNIVGSNIYAYRGGTYYSGSHAVPGIGC